MRRPEHAAPLAPDVEDAPASELGSSRPPEPAGEQTDDDDAGFEGPLAAW